ncbi:MAG: beta-ketoacyl synthase N-terminal-like domain-containing protein [Thermoanaerobaculia bacterium]
MTNRVVITGIGPFAPRAFELFSIASKVTGEEGTSSSAPVLRIRDAAAMHAAPQLRQMDRLGRIALVAAELALADADLDVASLDPETIGIALGSGYGCLATNADYLEGIRDRGSRRGNPIIFQNTVSNAATGYISLAKGIRGPNATMCSGWVAGLEALDFGVCQIADGRVQTMIVGGVDQLFPALVDGLSGRLTQLSEGSCFLVLEELERARVRGARIYAEVVASSRTSGTGEDQEHALAQAVSSVLRESGDIASDIDMIVSGRNGSLTDSCEARGLERALGPNAARVCAPKRILGETMGSGGSFAVAVAALTLESGELPLTLQVASEYDSVRPELVLVPLLGNDGSAAATLLRRVR